MQKFALFPEKTKGRLYNEKPPLWRSDFQRDRDRIIHSTAFRRLEYKTQVFVNHEGDHYRTRLTHSIEVAQIARSIARTLQVNEDLTEAIALAHDLGHTPFGHAGEDALNEAMAGQGGFNHNSQTLKIITKLEKCYAGFDGLNLTWEALEGIAKHHGKCQPVGYIKEYNNINDLQLELYPSIEGQVAAISDDIAYNNHDIDDGLRADFFTINQISDIDMVGEIFFNVKREYPEIINDSRKDRYRLIHETARRIITKMATDLMFETRKRISEYRIKTVDDVRNCEVLIVSFSEKMQEDCRLLKMFLKENMYKHPQVNKMRDEASKTVKKLFEYFYNSPDKLPVEWQKDIDGNKAEIVADFVAGMTDRFAIQTADGI